MIKQKFIKVQSLVKKNIFCVGLSFHLNLFFIIFKYTFNFHFTLVFFILHIQNLNAYSCSFINKI